MTRMALTRFFAAIIIITTAVLSKNVLQPNIVKEEIHHGKQKLLRT